MNTLKALLSRIHMPSAAVLVPYLGVVADVLHSNPQLVSTITGKLGAAGIVAVPVALATIDSIVKKSPSTN